ncbi:MAG: hypothetical protein JWN14_4482 [Chthonomonadales bacterium]|nr:hypothetical protein [Chthonomonadales bacterium]
MPELTKRIRLAVLRTALREFCLCVVIVVFVGGRGPEEFLRVRLLCALRRS